MEICPIFLVEDDPWYGEILEYHLSLHPNYEVYRFRSGQECLEHLHKKPMLITLDYFLPDMTGEELYRRIRAVDPDLPVIVISSQENISTAVSLLKQGVYDYLVKDDNTKDLLWNALGRIRETQKLKHEVELLRQELAGKYDFEQSIKGSSGAIRKVFGLMTKAAATNINLSITGEHGTGKELLAKTVHYNSARRNHPFISLNVAAVAKDLLEQELFGYQKGAFAGAITNRPGKFEEANGGTLYLDEISELESNLQLKLLRLLQQKEITRIGGTEKIKLDTRLIVGTQTNLAEQVKAGTFREDLFYCITGLPIDLPPLRDRGCDVLILARHFLEVFCQENRLPEMQLSAGAKEKLLKYSYPGNIRELKAVIELAAVLSEGNEVTASNINFASGKVDEFFILEDKTMKEYTITIIQHFLKKYDKNVLTVAEKLDIGKSTIYKMIQNKELQFS